MNAKSPERLAYSIQRAAEESDLGRSRLYQAIKSGELKSRKFGRRRIILADDLRDFLGNLGAGCAA